MQRGRLFLSLILIALATGCSHVHQLPAQIPVVIEHTAKPVEPVQPLTGYPLSSYVIVDRIDLDEFDDDFN